MTGAFCNSGPKGLFCVSDQFSSNILAVLRSPRTHREFFRWSDSPEPDKFSSDSRNRARCRHVSERQEIGGIWLKIGPIPAPTATPVAALAVISGGWVLGPISV